MTPVVIAARITGFPKSGRNLSLSGGITRYYQSCVGRDFKALAEMAQFVLWDHLNAEERKIWLLLSKVIRHVSIYQHPKQGTHFLTQQIYFTGL